MLQNYRYTWCLVMNYLRESPSCRPPCTEVRSISNNNEKINFIFIFKLEKITLPTQVRHEFVSKNLLILQKTTQHKQQQLAHFRRQITAFSIFSYSWLLTLKREYDLATFYYDAR